MEVGGSDGGSTWQRHLDGVLSGVVIWNRLLYAGDWDGTAGEEEWRAGGGAMSRCIGWIHWDGWCAIGVRWCRCYKKIIIIWCWLGVGVWCNEEWVLSVDTLGWMKSHAVSWHEEQCRIRWFQWLDAIGQQKTNPPHHCEGVSRKPLKKN